LKQCEEFSRLRTSKTHIISNGNIVLSKARYWADAAYPILFDISANKDTTIVESQEQIDYKQQQEPQNNANSNTSEEKDSSNNSSMKNMTPLNELVFRENKSFVNVIGLIESVDSDCIKKTFNSNGGKKLSIKRFRLKDTTSTQVSVALWGKQAEDFSHKPGDIIYLQGVQITNFNGLSLSVLMNTRFLVIDPSLTIPVVQSLKQYWKEQVDIKNNQFLGMKRKQEE
jgi:hypothetical protein